MHSKRISIIGAVIVVAALAAVLGLGSRGHTGAKAAKAEHLTITSAEPTYPVYGTVDELTAASTLVVRASAERILPSERVLPSQDALAKLAPEKQATPGFLVTDVAMRIQKVVSGPAGLAGTEIRVTHLGGTDAKERMVAEHEPPSTPGHSYLLFLRQGPDGRFAVVGGPQGRFEIVRGTVQPGPGGEGPAGAQLHGRPVADVDAQVGHTPRGGS